MSIQLIIGLGNPGQAYEATRHNVGAWFVQSLAKQHKTDWRPEQKFKGQIASLPVNAYEVKLLLPMTYMNNSGAAVQTMAAFYKIPIENILVVHDELDFPPGIIRLKQAGGVNGHNGLASIAKHLGKNFLRLRIGIGRPNDASDMSNYVLSIPPQPEKKQIMEAIENALKIMPQLLSGNIAEAMQILHS